MIMQLSDFSKGGLCQPFSYAGEPSEIGSRIGGCAPHNAVPAFGRRSQKYFGTIELDGGRALTIFYSFDIHGRDEERDIIAYNNRPLFPSELLHAVIHQGGSANGNPEIRADVSCHQIVVEAVQRDLEQVDETVPYAGSKIRGRPFVDNGPLVGEAFDQLLSVGFRQLIQFDTPNPRTHPFVQRFPWDPGWLHVLVRGTTWDDCEFAFVVQQ